jgi:hypothetical protein
MNTEQLAKTLGYAGLIPFIVFSLGTWISLPLVENPHFILMTYAAVILAFMGAIHWGVAMSRPSDIEQVQLGLSVIPALVGWLALLTSLLYGYVLLVCCFSALYLADRSASKAGLLPHWYLPMRAVLTFIVVICLAAAAASII